MITVATLLWDANDASQDFSLAYDESWAEKLYRGFARNLTIPFRMICWTDRDRQFCEPIEQRRIKAKKPTYACYTEPYQLNEPMILVGLDTIVCGNVDHLAKYALDGGELAVPRDPIYPEAACNGVALVPGGKRDLMYDRWRNENDMEWIRENPHVFIDDLWPGQVLSWRVHIRGEQPDTWDLKYPEDLRICYFHGSCKPETLVEGDPWIQEHWR